MRLATRRAGAPLVPSKHGVVALPRGARLVACASDASDDDSVTSTQEIPIFPLGLCAHPMGEGTPAGATLARLWWGCDARVGRALKHAASYARRAYAPLTRRSSARVWRALKRCASRTARARAPARLAEARCGTLPRQFR